MSSGLLYWSWAFPLLFFCSIVDRLVAVRELARRGLGHLGGGGQDPEGQVPGCQVCPLPAGMSPPCQLIVAAQTAAPFYQTVFWGYTSFFMFIGIFIGLLKGNGL